MFSVTSDIQAGTSLKTAAPKPSRQDTAQSSDSFAALVDAATPSEPSPSSPSAATPAPRAASAPPPSRETTRSNDTDRTSQAGSTDKTQGKAGGSASRTDTAGSDATSDTTADKSAKTAADTAGSSDGKTADKKDGDQASADAATAATAAAVDQATVPTPVAVAIPSEITLAGAPTGPAATDAGDGSSIAPTPTTGPAGAAGPALTSPVDANAGLMAGAAKSAAATKATSEADTTTAGADATSTASGDAAASPDQTFTAALEATVPGGTKPTGKGTAQAKTGVAAGETGKSAEQGTAAPQGTHPQQTQGTGPAQQPTASAKPDNGEVEPTAKGNNAPSPSGHERSVAQANGQSSVPASDPTAQATATLQPQLSTPTASTSQITSANLTATAATSAAVPLHGLAIEIAASALNGKSRFEIRLDPAELGRIDVRIDVDRNGQVTSHLRVEKPETLAMLQQTAPQLQQALQDAGLKSNNSGLQFSLRDQNSSGQNGGDNQQNGNAQRLIVAEDETVPAQLAGRSYGRMFSAQGGVDIRV
ncbi:flagellar hook-length control protein [Bradyrhizobium sp. SSBR45G]|uniref:flagellar hook-length control protein FliK n=1 Tax=unclassified Bradyrhizobium TaxID=2631580 RepID=UPI0023429F2B|nr:MULTISPECIES: flagellar hook-length control protein FliK [unclassified Bradyrhizobium]GLH79706.1 flagellar hook-length control protein [Bradyrhizobium sp. SSBR45G]GLH87176.1 flagellar hook-length control protein [Bradyrhizobium sp. SSBR45R]